MEAVNIVPGVTVATVALKQRYKYIRGQLLGLGISSMKAIKESALSPHYYATTSHNICVSGLRLCAGNG